MRQTCYTLYGVRVDTGDKTYTQLHSEQGACRNNGSIGCFQAGADGRRMAFLALTLREVGPGDYVMHPGERPCASQADRHRWNAALRSCARRLELRIVDGPGWFTVPDEHPEG